jgi:predicted ATPase
MVFLPETRLQALVLQALADCSEATLHHHLAHLQAAEFLYETRIFPEQVYTFKHALTHEVAYGSLLEERRRVLHTRLVEILEALSAEHVAEQVERLAYHARRGEVWDKTVTYCRQAATRAWERAMFHESVTALDQAIQALAHLPEHIDTSKLAIDLRRRAHGALNALGEFHRSLTLLGEAESLSRALDDRGRLGWVLAGTSQTRRIIGDFDGAVAAGRQAFDLATALGDHALQLYASYFLGTI